MTNRYSDYWGMGGGGVGISAPIHFSCGICNCMTVSYLNCWCGGAPPLSATTCIFVTSLANGRGGGGVEYSALMCQRTVRQVAESH